MTDRARLRALGTVADQVVSSGGNFIVLVAALHTLDLRGIGICTFAYSAVVVIVGSLRPLVLQPLLIRFAACDEQERSAASRQASGSALLFGLGALGLAAVVSPGLPPEARSATVAAAFILPAFLVQDAWRYHMFAAGRQWAATFNDFVAASVTAVAILVMSKLLVVGVTDLLLAWGLGFLVAAMLGAVQLRTVPDPGKGLSWLRAQCDVGIPSAGATFVGQLSTRLCLALIGAVAGAAAVGQVSASMTLLMPINTLIGASASFAIPELARRRHQRRADSVDPLIPRLSVMMGLVAAGVAIVLANLPERLGEFYGGRNWLSAQPTLIPIAASLIVSALGAGPVCALLAMVRPRSVLTQSMLQTALQTAGAGIGVVLAGAHGAAWGLALGTACSVVSWWNTWRTAWSADTAQVQFGAEQLGTVRSGQRGGGLGRAPSA